eukprot:4313756-Pleurochrysis_carterae.AAC.2
MSLPLNNYVCSNSRNELAPVGVAWPRRKGARDSPYHQYLQLHTTVETSVPTELSDSDASGRIVRILRAVKCVPPPCNQVSGYGQAKYSEVTLHLSVPS